MSWRDGCAPRPPVAPGAEAVAFDFAAADQVGAALARARGAVDDGLAVHRAAEPLLAGWAGPHRAAFDRLRGDQEAALRHADLGRELARLRAAWDDAADAQHAANRRASTG